MKKASTLVWLALVLISLQAHAATTIQPNPREWLTVRPDGGSLSVATNKPTLIKVQCTASNQSVSNGIDPATPSNQTATLKPGQAIIASPIGGALVVKLDTPTSVKICRNAQTQTKWGVYDLVRCSRNGSLTFWGTITNVTKQSTAILPAVQKPKPSKVLLREVHVLAEMALDGAMFLDKVDALVRSAKTVLAKRVKLVGARWVSFDEERSTRSGEDKEWTWQKDPAGYDFLITCTKEFHEHSKYSFNEALEISANETWEVVKIKDPTKAGSWAVTYTVTGTGMVASDDEKNLAAAKALEGVIAPLREQVLEEIYSLIQAVRSEKWGISSPPSSQTAPVANHVPVIDPGFDSTTDHEYDDSYTKIKNATTTIEVHASDPDGDPLRYEWAGTPGDLKGEGRKLVWKRKIENGAVVGGKVELTVADDKGGKTIRVFILDGTLQ